MAKNNFFYRLEKWHKTTIVGLTFFMVAEAGLAYLFASLAIPTAHTWEWFLAAIFGLGVVHNFGLLTYKIFHDIKIKASGAGKD